MRGLVAGVTGPEFNRLLAGTAQLMMLHGALFATGLALSASGCGCSG